MGGGQAAGSGIAGTAVALNAPIAVAVDGIGASGVLHWVHRLYHRIRDQPGAVLFDPDPAHHLVYGPRFGSTNSFALYDHLVVGGRGIRSSVPLAAAPNLGHSGVSGLFPLFCHGWDGRQGTDCSLGAFPAVGAGNHPHQ